MKALFTISGAERFKPTPESFLQSLKAEFSEVGSNAKTLEINVYKYFSDYVMDLGVEEGNAFKLPQLGQSANFNTFIFIENNL